LYCLLIRQKLAVLVLAPEQAVGWQAWRVGGNAQLV
jgi:hypothetical protein